MPRKPSKAKKIGVQNRYYPRLQTEILLAYRPLSSSKEKERIVTTRTLGLGGLMFEADHPLTVGSTYIFDLVLGNTKMEVKARVVYSIGAAPDQYQNGFSFEGLTDQQRDLLTMFFLQEYEKLPRDLPG